MNQLLRFGLLTVAGAASLAACGGGGGNGGGIWQPPVVVTTTQEKFGTSFAQVFNKDANSDPTDPVPDSAVPALTLTSDPIDIPN